MKKNERNAGRKSIPDPIRKQYLIPKKRVGDVDKYVHQIQKEAIEEDKNNTQSLQTTVSGSTDKQKCVC